MYKKCDSQLEAGDGRDHQARLFRAKSCMQFVHPSHEVLDTNVSQYETKTFCPALFVQF